MKNGTGLITCEFWEPHCRVPVESPAEDDKKLPYQIICVPVSFCNDNEDIDERPRIEIENGWFLIILRVPVKTTDSSLPYATNPLGIIFKDGTFVSVCFQRLDMVFDFIQYTHRKVSTKKTVSTLYSGCCCRRACGF